MSVSVVKLTKGWSFEISVNGTVGTRTYVEADALPGLTPEDLPELGDAWGTTDTEENCTLKRITIRYLDEKKCFRTYECSYDSTAYDPSQVNTNSSGTPTTTAEEDLPLSIENGGEVVAWEPPKNIDTHHWSSDGASVKQPLFRLVSLTTIRMQRAVYSASLADFLAISVATAGKVNEGTFAGLAAGTVLYTGCNANLFRNTNGKNYWKIDLMFSVRNVPDPQGSIDGFSDGWNWQLRDDTGLFDAPYQVDSVGPTGLYEKADFGDLITASAPVVSVLDLGTISS